MSLRTTLYGALKLIGHYAFLFGLFGLSLLAFVTGSSFARGR